MLSNKKSYLNQDKIAGLWDAITPPERTKNINLINSFKDDGVVIAGNYVDKETTNSINMQVDKIVYGNSERENPDVFQVEHENATLNIIYFAAGRQDMWPIDSFIDLKEILSKTDSLVADVFDTPIVRKSVGVLPLGAKTMHQGKWHRDTSILFKTGKGVLADDEFNNNLPDYYVTVFIPLVDLHKDNGATQIILGSHRRACNDLNDLSLTTLECSAGDIILMNGKCLHRAMPNISETNRNMLYVIYTTEWYAEERF